MNFKDRKSAITWLIASIVTLGGIFAALDQVSGKWELYGWITRKQYRIDHVDEGTSAKIIKSIQEVKNQVDQVSAAVVTVGGKVDGFETKWNCDELDEDLPGLRRWRDRAEGTDRYYDADQAVKKGEDLFDDLNCSEILE